jgi:hypothetical protein
VKYRGMERKLPKFISRYDTGICLECLIKTTIYLNKTDGDSTKITYGYLPIKESYQFLPS